MREIARRADPSTLPDPLVNPHTRRPARGERWSRGVQLAMYFVLFFGLGASAVFLGLERWRRATFAFGATMLWLALLRVYLPDSLIGVLSVRSRRFDVAFCALLGAGMVFLSSSVDALGS